jgi:hypothetical protein
MIYTIELDKDELKLLKILVRQEFYKEGLKLKNEALNKDAIESTRTKLLLIGGKLDNIIPVADKIPVKED